MNQELPHHSPRHWARGRNDRREQSTCGFGSRISGQLQPRPLGRGNYVRQGQKRFPVVRIDINRMTDLLVTGQNKYFKDTYLEATQLDSVTTEFTCFTDGTVTAIVSRLVNFAYSIGPNSATMYDALQHFTVGICQAV